MAFVKGEYGDLREYTSIRFESRVQDGPVPSTSHQGTRAGDEVAYGESGHSRSVTSDDAFDEGSGRGDAAGSEARASGGQPPGNAGKGPGDIWQALGDARRPAEGQAAQDHLSGDRWRITDPEEGLPRYDWSSGGGARLVRDMPGTGSRSHDPAAGGGVGGGHGGSANGDGNGFGYQGWRREERQGREMGIGRVVLGPSAWDTFTAHPT